MATSISRLETKSHTQDLYDRIADVHNLALKLNGYRDSVAKYLRSLDLNITPESLVLDAGSGTGIVTMSLQDSGYRPKRTIAFDLSYNSLRLSRAQFRKDKKTDARRISTTQGNVLSLPFADETFDVIITCGVLEYVPLDDGLRELARVLKPEAKLVLMPVKPSLIGSVLEFLYNFRIHPIKDVRKISQRYFKIVGNHKFPMIEPISWSKTIFLLEKS
ncbi:MAG: class I SAM-dependent methyltransferase [Pyrinomonadaceae bacterium]